MLRAKCIELHDTWKKFDLYMYLQFLAILVEIYQKDPEHDPNNMPENRGIYGPTCAAKHHCAGITLRAYPYRGLVYESLMDCLANSVRQHSDLGSRELI